MKPSFQLHTCAFHRTMALAMLVLVLPTMALLGQTPPPPTVPPPSAGPNDARKPDAPLTGAMEVHFSDASVLKVVLKDERIELDTPYGKLLIPVADIQRIEVGLRVSEDVRKRIDTAIADLGHPQRGKAAMAELISLKEKAYPAVRIAAKGKDADVASRAEQVLAKLREAVAESLLERPTHDVVYTATSKIAGRIKGDAFRVSTSAFGEQQVKLADVRSIRSQNVADLDPPAEVALVDRGTLDAYQSQIGKTLTFKVTAPQPAAGAQMGVWGTDIYTMDSTLAQAAVHAGVLRPGQSGLVRVTILGPQPGFRGSSRNGVNSHDYGAWAGYRIEQPRSRP